MSKGDIEPNDEDDILKMLTSQLTVQFCLSESYCFIQLLIIILYVYLFYTTVDTLL